MPGKQLLLGHMALDGLMFGAFWCAKGSTIVRVDMRILIGVPTVTPFPEQEDLGGSAEW